MNTLIAKAQTATTEQLLEMAMLLTEATDKIGSMSRMAVMVVLEDRLGSDAFSAFCEGLDG